MKTFALSAHVTVSATTDVEAETLEEAIKIAKDREVELHTGCGDPPADVWLIEDADGSPEDIQLS